MEKIVLKLKFQDQLRRVNLENRPVAISEVHQIISQLFPSLRSYSLFYHDEEGDRIIVETDLELKEALQVALLSNPKIPVIRLDVEVIEEGKNRESKAPEVGDEKKRTLFTLLPQTLFSHPFAKRCAEMVLRNVEHLHGNAFLGPFVASWGAFHGHGLDFVRTFAQSVIDGVDCQIPDHIAQHPFFSERCEWLNTNKSEILAKFDKMEAGLEKLGEKESGHTSYLPPDVRMMMLWACNGDADAVIAQMNGGVGGSYGGYGGGYGGGFCGGAGPNINVQAPGFSYVHSSCFNPGASFSFSFGDGSMGSSSFSSSSSTTSTSSNDCSATASVKININGEDVVDVEGMSIAALKQFLREKNISFVGVCEKEDLKNLVRDSVQPKEHEASPEQPQQPPPPKSKREETIDALLVLGFPRSEIEEALDATNDDANLAADRLLGGQ